MRFRHLSTTRNTATGLAIAGSLLLGGCASSGSGGAVAWNPAAVSPLVDGFVLLAQQDLGARIEQKAAASASPLGPSPGWRYAQIAVLNGGDLIRQVIFGWLEAGLR